jgi:hypothetical protein
MVLGLLEQEILKMKKQKIIDAFTAIPLIKSIRLKEENQFIAHIVNGFELFGFDTGTSRRKLVNNLRRQRQKKKSVLSKQPRVYTKPMCLLHN